MPLNRPILDDRSYEQLRDELIRRIPVYAPEWTDHNASDPGITLIELFSFLGENLLYRFNQIPDATYMEYLRLLQIPLRPAAPSHAMVVMSTEKPEGIRVPTETRASAGDVFFETREEVRVLPLSCLGVSKSAKDAPPTGSEEDKFYRQAMQSAGLKSDKEALPYQSETVSEDGTGEPVDFSIAVDKTLWVAVLAAKADEMESIKKQLAGHKDAPLLLNIGFVPDLQIEKPEKLPVSDYIQRFQCPGERAQNEKSGVDWHISTGKYDADGIPVYSKAGIEGDSTDGLTREGVVRLQLPRSPLEIGDFEVDDPDKTGTGSLPPRLDDEDTEARILFWLKASRTDGKHLGKVVYVGANATRIVQTVRADAEMLGTGTGQPHQRYTLVHGNVVRDSVVLEVEAHTGWCPWTETDTLFTSTESDLHFALDAESGTIRFGDGIHGYVPQIGQRIRVRGYRYGGGVRGNVAVKAVTKLAGINGVKVFNPLPAYGGEDEEEIEAALTRIPGELRRRDRAVTSDDFKELAKMTPGAGIGRAECLPRYHPELPQTEAPGVVSVIVWPKGDAKHPNAPMPNRNQVEAVCKWLDARRLVTTEHYVLPPRYRRIAVAVGIVVKPGYGIDAVRHWVELVIRQYLAPLPPYGPAGEGWPLGRRVYAPELEAAALQVEGVEYIEALEVAGWKTGGERVENKIVLEKDEVPELIEITVEEGGITQKPGTSAPPSDQPEVEPVPVPTIQEIC